MVDIHLATKNINVLTTGSPIPGNKDFANYFNKNKGDIITKMPLRSKFNHVHSSKCLENGIQQKAKVYNVFVFKIFKHIMYVCYKHWIFKR